MVSVNHIVKPNEDEELRMVRKNSLQSLQVVMKHLHNINGIGLIHSDCNAQLKDGLVIVVELDLHQLSQDEIDVIGKLGLQLPLTDRDGDEIKVDRINLDSDDIKILKNL